MFFSKITIATLALISAAIAAPTNPAGFPKGLVKRDDWNGENWTCMGPDGYGGCDETGAAYTCSGSEEAGFIWKATGGSCGGGEGEQPVERRQPQEEQPAGEGEQTTGGENQPHGGQFGGPFPGGKPGPRPWGNGPWGPPGQ